MYHALERVEFLRNLQKIGPADKQMRAFGADAWSILSDIELSIKNKIEAVGTPLKDWNVDIFRGVLTGYNDAFIISSEKREEI